MIVFKFELEIVMFDWLNLGFYEALFVCSYGGFKVI